MDEREKKRLTQRAMQGDHEAAKLLTEAGVAIPCPFCGENGMPRNFGGDGAKWVSCSACYCDGAIGYTRRNAIQNWNTRAPILSAEEMELLDEGWSD